MVGSVYNLPAPSEFSAWVLHLDGLFSPFRCFCPIPDDFVILLLRPVQCFTAFHYLPKRGMPYG